MTLGHRMPMAFLRQVDIWPQTLKTKTDPVKPEDLMNFEMKQQS